MVIRGIQNIATYLGIGTGTVYEYIAKYNLPIRKLHSGQNAPVMTTSALLDKWVEESLYNPAAHTAKK